MAARRSDLEGSPPASTTIWESLGTTDLTLRRPLVAGHETRVLEAGSGPPLVLMHGTGGHLEAFARNLAAFAARFRVIAYDFPGHGYSATVDTDLEIAAYEEHLEALLDEAGIERAALMGESLGGWVAAKFAAHRPQRVERLVLNTPGGRTVDLAVMERIRTLTQEAADDPTPERLRARLEWLMADPRSVTDELVEVRRAIYARDGFADSVRHVLCLVDEETRRRNLLTDEELAAIEAPSLVLWTSDDPSAPVAVGEEMAAKIAGAEFAYIAGAGHWPQWEQPDAYHEIVLPFLAGA
jgi:2-hydroxy-6-oxonona-2,4-dienedioate hydrolase